MAEGVPLSGLARLGGGREAEIFAWGEGRVLRLAHDRAHEPAVDREARALAAAGAAGAPVPELYERVRVEGRPGTVMERVDGESLLERLGRRPWAVLAGGRALGRLHARIHAVVGPPELPRLHAEVARLLDSDLVPADLRRRASATLAELPDDDRLCHGDFHPANVLAGHSGHVVIDWTNGVRGHPAADVARTCLILMAAALPADAPPLIARLDLVGRRLLLGRYLAAYRRERPLDLTLVERWLAVCATARLGEGIDAERARMIAIAAQEPSGPSTLGVQEPGEAPALGVPGARPLPRETRRWLVVNALVLTAFVNLVLNAGIAWLSARGAGEVPLWPSRIGETNLVTDTIGTLFILPFVTCLVVTTAVWREVASGELRRLPPGADRVPWLGALPRNRLARGLALGALCVALLGPPAAGLLWLLDPGALGLAAFVSFKAALGVALGAVVTPVIALRAMADGS